MEECTWIAEEGTVREDEAECGLQFCDQSAGLESEGFGCDAAAVETEDARGGERGVWFWRHCV